MDRDTLAIILKSMDTEYDRNVLRSVLALCCTRSQMFDLGIDPSTARKNIDKITDIAKECEHALIAGEALVLSNLLSKQERMKI